MLADELNMLYLLIYSRNLPLLCCSSVPSISILTFKQVNQFYDKHNIQFIIFIIYLELL